MKSKLIPIAVAGLCLNMARADFNPVTLAPGSFTVDIVVESNTLPAVPYCINVTAGGGIGLGDNSYYEQGLRPGNNSGIPRHNTVFTNINNSSMLFLMPPTYATSNTLMIDSTFTTGTITFNTPTNASSLALLGAGCGGGTTLGYTVTHADSTTDTGTTFFPDWFNGGATVAWGANGRMDTGGNYNNFNSSSVNNNAPYFYGNTISVSTGSPIVSITFTFNAGAHGNVLAVSGSTNGTSYKPIPIGGFNVMAIIPATVPLPVTALMDTGTNISTYTGNMNTWFEQGFVRGSPNVGLPPSGSVFNSFSQPTHHYQMGNYSANNAILIDTNHQTAVIALPSPAAYTSFAFLTAGANNGSPMQDSCILQHADGVSETNLFYGYDWFYSGAPGALAFQANGRVNMSDRTVNNISNNVPYLFETYFALSDTVSPVTNIIVKYKSASAVNSTTYIMAISASTNPVAPLITAGPTPLQQAWFTTQTATMSVQVVGSQPLTNKWLVERSGVYVPLSDGTDANGSIVSGSSTTALTINNLSVLDGTNYEFIAANSVGSATSAVASVSIRTGIAGLTPVTNWNNIANTTYTPGNSTNIFSGDKSLTATLTLLNGQSTNGYASGITGDGANASLMNGYMDTRKGGGSQPTIDIDGLTGSSYNVILYTFGDQSRPSNGTDGLPNWAVNGTIYYAATLGGISATKWNSTGTNVGGTGFNGFIPATILFANDFTNDILPSEFGNCIVISNVAPSGGEIQVIPQADFGSARAPLNGIELVDTSNASDNFGIHFLGTTGDTVSGTPVAPIIDSQAPSDTLYILTNHTVVSTFSVTIDGSSSSPVYYQWYKISAANITSLISGATNSTLINVDTTNLTLFCVITNLAGSATSVPVAISIVLPPTPSGYASAVMALHPVAYWPLSEISGNVAFDYVGTNDGVYNGNYILGTNGLPPTPGIGTNTSVYFDGSSAYVDIPASGGSGDLNLTGPSTIMEWVLVPGTAAAGFGTALGHSDQSYRLSVVNASGNAAQPRYANAGPDVLGNNSIADGNWHLLTGVYDGANQKLYVDGKLAGSAPPNPAPPGSPDDVMIAAAPDYLGARNFKGNIAQVAIYNTALSAAQIAQIYGSVDTAPIVSITPANPSTYSGNDVTLTANLSGTPATKLQWFYIDTSSISNNIAGATSNTYTIVAPPASYNGYTFGVIAGNAYGTNVATVTLSVSTAPAALAGDVGPAFGEAYVGAPAVYTVFASGSLPINYQWTLNGLPINGATNASLTLATPCGTNLVQVSFTNEFSAGSVITSSQATLVGDAAPPVITFNTTGTNWQLQGTGITPSIGTNILLLTDNKGSEASSAFYVTAQYVGGFNASFIYTAGGNLAADGTCFVIQNNGAGTNSLGGGGGELGYGGITNSVALQINLFQGAGITLGFDGSTYGNGGSPYLSTAPVYVNSADPIQFNLSLANGVLAVDMIDKATLQTFSTNYPVGPLSAYTGSSLSYVGFTGGTGGSTSIQSVKNFEFQSVIPPVSLAAKPGTGHTVVLSWSAADPSYVLQTNTSLSLPTWSAGPVPVTVNGVSSVTVNIGGANTQVYYRLQREVCP